MPQALGDDAISVRVADPTPFGTRHKLLTLYAEQTHAVMNGGDCFPVALEVNISNYCNQNCGWCISANVRNGHYLNVEDAQVKRFFEDFGRLGGRCVGWSGGGEPTMHPGFAEAMDLVHDANLVQGLITHGGFSERLVTPIARRCAWVRMSIDTPDRALYALRRRTDGRQFDAVLVNAQRLAELGVVVGLNMNVSDWNANAIERLYDLATEIKVAYLQVRPTLPTPFPSGEASDHLSAEKLPEITALLAKLQHTERLRSTRLVVSWDKFADLRRGDDGRTYRGCQSHRLFVILNWDGSLNVCMYHLYDKRFILGNIFEDPLERIWHSAKRREVVSFCGGDLDHRRHGCQVCCKGHEINKVINGEFGVPQAAPSPVDSPFI